MSTPFMSEIRIMSFNFAPKGWAQCNGQLLPINQNQALFALLGTTYGGDGRVNFALPNLQGKTPLHMGSGFTLGQTAGEQNHTLSISELPTHVHTAVASSSAGSVPVPPTAFLGSDTTAQPYLAPDNNLGAMSGATIANLGGSQAHPNMQPYLGLNFCIALTGIFPSQN